MSDPYADDAKRAQRLSKGLGNFMRRYRRWIARYPWLERTYKVVITVLGVLIVIIGLILVPLPGPGWLIVFIGLALLGSEYHWARRILGWLRQTLAKFWERWHAWRDRRQAKREAARRHRDQDLP